MVTGSNRSLMQAAKTWWATKNINPLGLMSQNKCVCGFHLGHMADRLDLIRGVMEELLDLFKQGKIKPRIDSTWAYEDVSGGTEFDITVAFHYHIEAEKK